MLEEGKAISKIAEEVNITRQIVYRIKNELLGNAKPTND